jgi:putative transposase
MGRALRVNAGDVSYHVTARGVRRLEVYQDPIDYRKFESLLETVVRKRRWEVHAYCQMPNHYHLLLNTPDADISAGLHWLNGIYARWFNERHRYTGHVFEARFHAVLVRHNVHLLNLACYLPLNPVRGRLCGRPAEWEWSSYRATTGRARKSWLNASWLLAQFGSERAAAVVEYERYVLGRMAA